MRNQLNTTGTIKQYIHAGQAIIIFLSIILTIAIFTRNGSSDGRIGWYFGLVRPLPVPLLGTSADRPKQCFLTIPILIYLTLTPMFSRAFRISNPYAFAALDLLSIILWLSAWASMASYVASGKGHGSNSDKSGCENFKYGSPGRCKLSTGTTILGVLLMLMFIATFFISFRAVMLYRQTGILPTGKASEDHVPTQNAFNPNMANGGLDEEQPVDTRLDNSTRYQQPYSMEQEYVPIAAQGQNDLYMPSQQPVEPLSMPMPPAYARSTQDTSYDGARL